MDKTPLAVLSLLLSLHAANAAPIDVERPEVRRFIDNMVERHEFEVDSLRSVLAGAESQQSILDAIARPAEKTLAWHEYRAIFLTDERVAAGAAFWREHAGELGRISEGTGVDIEILVGIIGVETYFGRITGRYRVLDALVTLAFDYPPRSKFFTRELEEFLLLVREEGIEAGGPTGSYAGAMGAPQFMPSSFRAYAVDSSDDGRRDIWTNWSDVIGSVANYFVEHGWQAGNEVVAQATLSETWQGPRPENGLAPKETVGSLSQKGVLFSTSMPVDHKSELMVLEGTEGDEYWVGFHNFYVITRYNRSVMYALAVHQLGQEIALEVGSDAS
ncbi:MAG: lytic murein transglycosylase B [Gammaproteobacteria bacterium]|nr:lytic murein transglycosylase B [Gammaproteobacteria bacterium]MDH4254427.1 lytic murein transglycosylase B [Gammaproteobacteria bacterium]MDH5311088.1 lytic murein transglycosylase B [Gammaproteobacteria bacterium]